MLPNNSPHSKFVAKFYSKKRSVELVIPYCHEPASRILAWYKPAFSRFVTTNLLVTVVMKCGDDSQKRQIPRQIFNGTRALRFLEIQDEEVRGDECSGYFGFLEKRYGTFADYTMFVHPDADEHIMINLDSGWVGTRWRCLGYDECVE